MVSHIVLQCADGTCKIDIFVYFNKFKRYYDHAIILKANVMKLGSYITLLLKCVISAAFILYMVSIVAHKYISNEDCYNNYNRQRARIQCRKRKHSLNLVLMNVCFDVTTDLFVWLAQSYYLRHINCTCKC